MSDDKKTLSIPSFVRGDQTSMVLSACSSSTDEASSSSSSNSSSSGSVLQAKILQVGWDNADMVKEVTSILNEDTR